MKICKVCNKELEYSNFSKHPTTKDGFFNKCKICCSSISKEWYNKNKLKRKEYKRKYRKNKLNNDPLFKLKRNLSKRTYAIFKNKEITKNNSTNMLLGTNINNIFNHIENKFTEDMSWDNYGKWHIDHITPLASATTEKELITLCHYSNLQPLWAKDNLQKGCKII